MKFLLTSIAVFLLINPQAQAGGSPQEIHDQFMGYSREYDDKSREFSREAGKSQGEDRTRNNKLSELYRKMAVEKRNMAKAFLSEDWQAKEAAEKRYHKLKEAEGHVWNPGGDHDKYAQKKQHKKYKKKKQQYQREYY